MSRMTGGSTVSSPRLLGVEAESGIAAVAVEIGIRELERVDPVVDREAHGVGEHVPGVSGAFIAPCVFVVVARLGH